MAVELRRSGERMRHLGSLGGSIMGDKMLPVGGDDAFWEPGELERVAACPGCEGGNLGARYGPLDDLLERVPGRWLIVECRDCGSLSLDPRPTRQAIGKAYAASYLTHRPSSETHERDNGTTMWWRLANGYLNGRYGCSRQPASKVGRSLMPVLLPLRQQLDYFYRHLPRTPGRLLDVGCGNGLFLLRAQEAGWDVEGLEPDPMAAKSAAAAGLRIHAALPEAFHPAQPYDRVTLSHVFEHVHQPAGLLKECLRLLKPDGEVWLSLPNIAGVGSRLYGQNWFALDPPRHLFLPTPAVIQRLLNEAGFVDVRMRRRGRGARTNLCMSETYAKERGSRRRWVWAWVAFIDIISSVYAPASEELVISARKPKGES